MRPDAFITAIDDRLAQHAKASMTHPAGTSGDAYCRAIGHYTGLEEAKQIWIKLREEEQQRDRAK